MGAGRLGGCGHWADASMVVLLQLPSAAMAPIEVQILLVGRQHSMPGSSLILRRPVCFFGHLESCILYLGQDQEEEEEEGHHGAAPCVHGVESRREIVEVPARLVGCACGMRMSGMHEPRLDTVLVVTRGVRKAAHRYGQFWHY